MAPRSPSLQRSPVKRPLALAALLLSSCSPAGGGDPALDVSEPWARETIAGQGATAAYLQITNSGTGPDRLVGVAAEEPIRASLHETRNSDGIARMRLVEDGLEIGAGETLVLEPGGAHIMLENLPAPVSAGDSISLTLQFEHWGDRTVQAQVREAGAAPAGHHQ